jgi:hypothetical protein
VTLDGEDWQLCVVLIVDYLRAIQAISEMVAGAPATISEMASTRFLLAPYDFGERDIAWTSSWAKSTNA